MAQEVFDAGGGELGVEDVKEKAGIQLL